jgi:hypothetical protein
MREGRSRKEREEIGMLECAHEFEQDYDVFLFLTVSVQRTIPVCFFTLGRCSTDHSRVNKFLQL